MKISALLIAASVVVGALGAGAASADHGDRHDNGRRGYERHDGGHRDGMRDHRRHCRTEWRHHRRVTRCY